MNRYGKSALVLLAGALVVGAAIGAVAVFAGDLGTQEQAEVAPDVIVSNPVARPVVAKGVVVPLKDATLSMSASGIVAEILVPEGHAVEAGQVILQLHNERQQAALAEADAVLASAKAQLGTLRAGARSEEIAAAEASLEGAQARAARLEEGGREADIVAAEASLRAAQAALQRVYAGADETTRIAAQADLANAAASLRMAQAAYDQVKGQNNVAMLPQSLQLEQATNAHQAARARYDEVTASPKADRIAAAAAEVNAAQARLDRLVNPATAAELAEVQAMVRQAQAQLDMLKAGVRTQELDAAEAAVARAEAGRRQAVAALSETQLVASFDGVLAVLSVRAGEQVAAGLPVAELGDLSGWLVETDDLSELDVARVQPGQIVDLTFDAIPDLALQGVVERVQQKGEKKLGDMTYTAVIRIEEPEPRLLWNMTAVMTIP